MSSNLNTQFQAYQRQFNETLTHLYELDRPYLIDATMVDMDIEGMTKVFKRIGSLETQRKTGRNEVANLTEPEYSARHLTVATEYVATPVDMEDVFKMVSNPKDDIYQECVNAIYEAQTEILMDGFFQDVIINEDGGATSSFPAANQVAVNYSGGKFDQNSGAADVGLNLDKLLRVKVLISDAKVRVNTTSMNRLHIAVSEDDVQTLMSGVIGTDQFPMIDSNFTNLKMSFEKAAETIVDGMFYWNGFHFHVIPPSYFKVDANGDRRLPVWIQDGMVFGIKENVNTEIMRLPSTVESTKIQALTRVGALRKHDAKVYEIKAATP